MGRKRVTEIFPFLIPLRVKQKCFFLGKQMERDENTYSDTIKEERLPYLLFKDKSTMINPNTGMDIIYQYNKVHNLKLAARTMNGVLIKPGECFSYFWLARHAEENGEKYKDGLIDRDDKLVADKGGGICQLTNNLFWIFLHTDMSIVERHNHDILDFPYPEDGVPEGTDATVSDGWQDLIVRNDTDITYQVEIEFDEECMWIAIYADTKPEYEYRVLAKNGVYYRDGDKVMRRVSLMRDEHDFETGELIKEVHLYDNVCEIGYEVEL